VFLHAVVALDAYFVFVTTLTTHVAPSLFFFSHLPALHLWCSIFQFRIFSAPLLCILGDITVASAQPAVAATVRAASDG